MKSSHKNKKAAACLENEHQVDEKKVGRGYLTGPGLYEFPVEYEVVDGIALHEGCIELGPVEEVEEHAQHIRAKHQNKNTIESAGDDHAVGEDIEQAGVGISPDSSMLWTNGVVPYSIASNVPDHSRINDAISHIEVNTAIRFIRRTNGNAHRYPNFLEIVSNGDSSVSSSRVGMQGGRQSVRFSDRHGWNTLVHEFLHALGIYHEQSRSDRDEHVEIRWNNIPDGPPPDGEINRTGNFQKKPSSVDYFDYDYDSIMHYRWNQFAIDRSEPTIVPLKPGVTIGQREKLSYGDRQTIAKMYERYFPRGYTGVWRAGSGRYGLWVNASWTSFTNKWAEWSQQGLRLHDIHVQQRGRQTLYSGVFLPGTGRYGLWANVSWTSFRNKWRQWSRQGLRLVDLHIHRSGNQNRYSGVFLPGSGSHGLWVNSSWSNFKNKWQTWNNQGLRLVDIHVHRIGGQNRYSGVFLRGSGGHGLWVNATWTSFTSKWQEWSRQGLRLVDISQHRVGNSVRYTGAFLPGTDSYYLWANTTFESFRAKWEELAEQGLRLIDFEILNPAVGAADVADATLENSADGYEDEAFPEFGGVFGSETGEDTTTRPPDEDSGGGLGPETGSSEVQEGSLEMAENGAAYFPNSSADGHEQEEGLGEAFFENDRESQIPEEAENCGEAMFLSHT